MNKNLKHILQFSIINFALILGVIWTVKYTTDCLSAKLVQPIQVSKSSTPIVEVPVDSQNPVVAPASAIPITEAQPPKTTTPLDEFSQHNIKTDCWMVYDGHVYDITTYFGKHPGGDSIMGKYCGKDGTEAFSTKDRNPGKDHSSSAKAMLADYLIY